MAKYEILKNQPMPTKRSGSKYPFPEMEVGDCVHFPLTERPIVSSAADHWARLRDVKFSCRKIDEKTFGVWRVS